LPNCDDVRAGVIASKIAAHAGDVARGFKGSADRDKKLSIARANLDWKTHIAESLDPQTAERMHKESCKESGVKELPTADYCTMCGQQWCSVRTNRQVREFIKSQTKSLKN
jgi:phosphomethylpyrimidine synthase